MALDLRDVTNMQGSITSHIRQANQVLSENDSGCDMMDDSLTDMQWLQKMDASGEIPGMKHGGHSRKRRANFDEKSAASDENRVKQMIKESCRKKLDYCSVKKGTSNKPPLSYASLIALAICSTPQRMLTLSGIYRWIENTFPFYRTPEAKAWKNSIRHNLSIRKIMFQKVYQYPPRRGNGSYWTLLSDGEDELKRAIPLFSTFRPPLIDTNCVYNRVPMTHTVKSRGQYVPVLPRSGTVSNSQPYFSLGGSVINATQQEEVVVLQSSEETPIESKASTRQPVQKVKTPTHLLDHSYAKISPQQVYVEGPRTDFNCSFDSEATIDIPMTPKRRRLMDTPVKKRNRSPRIHLVDGQTQPTSSSLSTSFTMATPLRDQDISLGFLDSSLLTPLKDFVHNIEIGPQGISLSPLYANFVSPSRGDTPKHTVPNINLPSPLTPLKYSHTDSGIFTPFRPSDSLESLNLKCSTPMKFLSPITNILPPNTFNSPHQDIFLPLKVLDSSTGSTSTPMRLGSLQGLGLPGLTPPAAVPR